VRADGGPVTGALFVVLSFGITSGITACQTDHQARPNKDVAVTAAVRVEAEGCHDGPSVGGGSFIADHRVITVAHVVAGATEVDVVLEDGSEHEATVVAIDRAKDLAILAVKVDTIPLPRASMRAGARGDLVTWRNGGPAPMPFVAQKFVRINASDIDHGTTSLRRGYEIDATVEPGDSGSVLVSDGAAVAVLFGRSTSHRGRAYATDITEADALLATAGDSEVDLGVCARP
jgi:S1-C subfamily serine protease